MHSSSILFAGEDYEWSKFSTSKYYREDDSGQPARLFYFQWYSLTPRSLKDGFYNISNVRNDFVHVDYYSGNDICLANCAVYAFLPFTKNGFDDSSVSVDIRLTTITYCSLGKQYVFW